jgi:hypothetical protein
LGVQLFRTEKALKQYVESDIFEEPVDGITLLQEYIQSKNNLLKYEIDKIEGPLPFITRAEFIGGKFIYAVQVDTSEGFQLCPADHCQVFIIIYIGQLESLLLSGGRYLLSCW